MDGKGNETSSGGPAGVQAGPATDEDRERAELTARLQDLMARASGGDPKALATLRDFLTTHPEVHETIGDLGRLAEESWIDLLAGNDALVRESVRRQLKALKDDLNGPHPTSLEKLLVNHVAACHLAQRHAELLEAQPAPTTPGQAMFRAKRSESTQRRLLAAIRTLATVRTAAAKGLAPLDSIRLFNPGQRKQA